MNRMIKSALFFVLIGGLNSPCQSPSESLKPFFLALQIPNKPTRRFSAEAAPYFDPAKVNEILAPTGITLSGTEFPKGKSVPRKEVLRQLQARNGDAFRTFAHLGFLLSHPKPQYSTVQYIERGDRLIATLPTWYKLTFQITPNGVALLTIEDLNAGE